MFLRHISLRKEAGGQVSFTFLKQKQFQVTLTSNMCNQSLKKTNADTLK